MPSECLLHTYVDDPDCPLCGTTADGIDPAPPVRPVPPFVARRTAA